jgi:hypothetical protein
MFAEVKAGLPVSGSAYDGQIVTQIYAAVLDLTRTAEIAMPGEVAISIDAQTGTVTDNSTVTDAYVITAVTLWCQMNIGNPPNYDKLLSAYETLKGNMRLSDHYTVYPE